MAVPRLAVARPLKAINAARRPPAPLKQAGKLGAVGIPLAQHKDMVTAAVARFHRSVSLYDWPQSGRRPGRTLIPAQLDMLMATVFSPTVRLAWLGGLMATAGFLASLGDKCWT